MKRTLSCLFAVPLLCLTQGAFCAEAPPDARRPANKEVAKGRERVAAPVGSVSPDGQWELARAANDDEEQASYDDFLVRKRGRLETAVTLSQEAAGTFADAARIVWAPDSKRFAFQYQPGLRYQTLQFFQLDGDKWRELESPASDKGIKAPIERSMVAQRKKLKLPPEKSGRPISDTCVVRQWIDPATVLLLAEESETFEIKGELEQVDESCLVTLKFAPTGDWKVIRTRTLSGRKAGALNQVERKELDRMEKESEENESEDNESEEND